MRQITFRKYPLENDLEHTYSLYLKSSVYFISKDEHEKISKVTHSSGVKTTAMTFVPSCKIERSKCFHLTSSAGLDMKYGGEIISQQKK